ncbi:MAG: hypothetical protein Q7V63_08590 [Gammaproteobacteria bacterium]|nr:hypothetical protein [Gammaproteobacteria bacterium]
MSKVQDYMEVFAKAHGDNLAKVKHILMKCSDNWEWVGSDSVIADLLDDKNIAVQDILEFLKGAVEMGEGNREFKAAITAIDLSLKKTEKHEVLKEMDLAHYNDDSGFSDYHANDSYQSFAEAI